MTLILTCLTQRFVVQVSDIRLTYQGTDKRSDSATKTLFYSSNDARMAIAYTGLATIGTSMSNSMPIEEWIARTITDLPDGTPFGSVLTTLATSLDRNVAMVRHIHRDRRLSVVMAGYWAGINVPSIACISNFEGLGNVFATSGPRERPRLHSLFQGEPQHKYGDFAVTFKNYTGRELPILAYGDVTAVSLRNSANLVRSAERIHTRGSNPRGLRDCMITALRKAADTSEAKTISRDCWSAIILSDSPELGFHGHFEKQRTTMIAPRLVRPGHYMRAVFVNSDVKEEEKVEYERLIASGNLNIELNPYSLRVYINTSVYIRQWVEYAQCIGARIEGSGYIDQEIAMAKEANVRDLKGLNDIITGFDSWKRDYIKECIDKENGPNKSFLKTFFIMVLLIGSKPDILTSEVLAKRFGWQNSDEIVSLAKRCNPRFKGDHAT